MVSISQYGRYLLAKLSEQEVSSAEDDTGEAHTIIRVCRTYA